VIKRRPTGRTLRHEPGSAWRQRPKVGRFDAAAIARVRHAPDNRRMATRSAHARRSVLAQPRHDESGASAKCIIPDDETLTACDARRAGRTRSARACRKHFGCHGEAEFTIGNHDLSLFYTWSSCRVAYTLC